MTASQGIVILKEIRSRPVDRLAQRPRHCEAESQSNAEAISERRLLRHCFGILPRNDGSRSFRQKHGGQVGLARYCRLRMTEE
ncbi:MAG: hypothetical protein A3G87_02345 [Omnitrophica bacterium RIFCSPLOWO2_12_FULL_50_11]|nr:MAG: hypothetical protein A3G87_02345 [Omnitrophica bacterium RIFCSPLOWO2_12_FULL_50_11]